MAIWVVPRGAPCAWSIDSSLCERLQIPLPLSRARASMEGVSGDGALRIGPASVRRPLPIGEAIDRFAAYLLSKGRSADTVRRYPAWLRGGHAWRTTEDLTPRAIDAWLRAESAGGKNHNNRLAAVRRFCRWLKDVEGVADRNPARRLERASEAPEEGVGAFTTAEMRRIIEAASGRRRALYIVAATTGLRKGTLCRGITAGMVDLKRRMLDIPPRALKNRRRLRIPVNDEAFAVLEERCRGRLPHEPVFPFTVDNRTLFDDMKAAGVPRIDDRGERRAWHSFRKGFVTALAERNVPPAAAQRLAGHSDPRLTLRVYSRVGDPALRRAVRKLSTMADDVLDIGPATGCVRLGAVGPTGGADRDPKVEVPAGGGTMMQQPLDRPMVACTLHPDPDRHGSPWPVRPSHTEADRGDQRARPRRAVAAGEQ